MSARLTAAELGPPQTHLNCACCWGTGRLAGGIYCASCQRDCDETLGAHERRMAARNRAIVERAQERGRRAGTYDGSGHRRYVGIGPGRASDFSDFTEVDWQDALNPNEGDR